MIELARFTFARRTWALGVGSNPEDRLLLSAQDRRVYGIVPLRAAGRVVPLSDLARLPDPNTGRLPWEGWYVCVVLLGDADRRRVLYDPWPDPVAPGDPLASDAAPMGEAFEALQSPRQA